MYLIYLDVNHCFLSILICHHCRGGWTNQSVSYTVAGGLFECTGPEYWASRTGDSFLQRICQSASIVLTWSDNPKIQYVCLWLWARCTKKRSAESLVSNKVHLTYTRLSYSIFMVNKGFYCTTILGYLGFHQLLKWMIWGFWKTI